MLSITLLGRFSASFGTEPLPLHDGSKAQELFVYLLLRRQHAHTREEIASHLWEEADTGRSKAYLRKALWQLQGALAPPPGAELPSPILAVQGEWIRLHPDAALWLDIAVVEDAYVHTRPLSGARLLPASAAALNDAAALYIDDLLPDHYQHWCLEERERIKHMYLCILEKLVEFSEAQGEYEAGLAHGRRLLVYDSTREDVHRRLMRLHLLRGDRAGALRQYRQCVEVLASELDIPPMAETTELYERIRSDDMHTLLGAPPDPSLREIVERLDHLQVVVDELRRSVDHAIRGHEARGD